MIDFTETMSGSELRRIRKACGVSIANFARAVKRSPWTVKMWEKGELNVPPEAVQFAHKMKRAARVHYNPQTDVEKYAVQRPIF